MTKIALQQCRQYQTELIKENIINGLHAIHFDTAQFQGAVVVLKPNLLMLSVPEQAVVTHPIFFQAVAQVVKQFGGMPMLVESPAFTSLDKVIKKTGYKEIIEAEQIQIPQINQTKTLHFQDGKNYKHFEISAAYFEADLIINLPKFKTHGFTYFTGAVKNFFGTMPGLSKSKMHMKAPSHEDFTDFLLDLYEAVLSGFKKPKTILTMMDAIVALEGEGPGVKGNPKSMDSIIIGTDAIAVDYVAVQLAGLDLNKALTITKGFERQSGITAPDEIDIIGHQIQDLKVEGFIPTKAALLSHLVRWPLTSKIFKNLFVERPVPDQKKCTCCYQCQKICPPKAISVAKQNAVIPAYDYKKCIRCFCCMEICPEAALEIKHGKLQWVMNFLT